MSIPNDATHYEPYSNAYYKVIQGKWFIWSRIENEPVQWIKASGLNISCLQPITNKYICTTMPVK